MDGSDVDFSEKYFDALSLADRVELCSFLSKAPKLNRAFEDVLLGENEKCDADAIGKVAYMKNNYTDQAYLKTYYLPHAHPIIHPFKQCVKRYTREPVNTAFYPLRILITASL